LQVSAFVHAAPQVSQHVGKQLASQLSWQVLKQVHAFVTVSSCARTVPRRGDAAPASNESTHSWSIDSFLFMAVAP
jgi:hypothetical protein